MSDVQTESSSVFNPNPDTGFTETELATEYPSDTSAVENTNKNYKIEAIATPKLIQTHDLEFNDTVSSVDTFDRFNTDATSRRDTDMIEDVKKAQSINKIIESLDNVSVVSDYDHDDDLRSQIRDFNDEKDKITNIISKIRVDMAKILSILKTQNEKINENTNESDCIKNDLHDIAHALTKLSTKIDNFNNEGIRRTERNSIKVDGQISKLAARIEALEKSNFVLNEKDTVDRTRESIRGIDSNANNSNNSSNNETNELNSIIDRLHVDKPKPKPRQTTDTVNGKTTPIPKVNKTISRAAARQIRYMDNVDNFDNSLNKEANRGLRKTNITPKQSKDVVKKTYQKPIVPGRKHMDIVNNL